MTEIAVGSRIWAEDKDQSRKHQYNYDSVERLLREVEAIAKQLYSAYNESQLEFPRDDRSAAKAAWMLGIECIETLADAATLLRERRHRVVGKLLRHAVESADLASLFIAQGDGGQHLATWYEGKVILHGEYREHLKHAQKGRLAQEQKRLYRLLSGWTHHTYYSLCNSYSVGAGDRLVHDSLLVNGRKMDLLILPETIYQYCWLLSVVVIAVLKALSPHGFLGDGIELRYVAGHDSMRPT